MACKCKVNTQIDYLHKKYGDDLPKSKKTNIRGNITAYVENILIYIMMIPFIPFLAAYSIIKSIKGETIHIDKLVKRV